ncbi:MAG: hypothetical protein IPL61_11120 [Myxococcales bacterium]|nr:hypothetical protein [Myxococcales bacterium]
MSRALALALALAAGCRSGGDRTHIVRSDGGGPAVQLVDRQAGPAATPRTPEREPNDDAATAIELAATGMRGALDGAADVDVYAMTSPGARLLTARLTGMAGIDGALDLRDEQFQLIATADRGGAGVAEGFPNISLDAGRYFLVVREIEHRKKVKGKVDAGPGRVGPGPAYELTATQAEDPPPDGEREPDDDLGAANGITLATPVTGYVGWKGDVDVWKLAIDGLADGDGLDVAVTAVDKVALTVEFTDAAGRQLVRQTGAAGAALTLRSIAPRVAPGEPTVQYVKVSGTPPNPDATYALTIRSRLLDLDEEAEPNDAVDRANPLRFGTEDSGTMSGQLGPGEVDRFALSPSLGFATLDVALDAPAGVDVTLTASGGAKGQGARSGARIQLSSLEVVPGQVVTLSVMGKGGKGVVAGPYQLRWSLSAPSAIAPDVDPMPPEEE